MYWFQIVWALVGIVIVAAAIYLPYKAITDDEFGLNRY